MWLTFDAVDVWFFRDGRPFDAGEAHSAHSRFPPPPETVLGAVRALLMNAEFAKRGQPGLDFPHFDAWVRHGGAAGAPGSREAIFADLRRRFGIGTTAGSGSGLTLRGPFLLVSGTTGLDFDRDLRLPAPRDLRRSTEVTASTAEVNLVRFHPLDGDLGGARWKQPAFVQKRPALNADFTLCPLVADTANEQELAEVAWLNLGQMETYLLKSEAAIAVDGGDDAWTYETRSGIALKPSRQTRESHLYSLDVVRPAYVNRDNAETDWDWRRAQLLVGVKLESDTDAFANLPTLLPLGGEGRLARVAPLTRNGERLERTPLDTLLQTDGNFARAVAKQATDGWLRVVLLQPAIFKRGWLPDGVGQDGILTIDSHRFLLCGAAVGKPLAISGWDLAKQAPKPLRQAVPAGSVFYFQHVGEPKDPSGAVRAFIQRYHGTSRLCGDRYWGGAGYGLSVVGICKPIRTSAAIATNGRLAERPAGDFAGSIEEKETTATGAGPRADESEGRRRRGDGGGKKKKKRRQ